MSWDPCVVTRRVGRTLEWGLGVLCLSGILLSTGCTATPQPDIPTDTPSDGVDPIDPERVRIDLGAGYDQVLVTGREGAANQDGTVVTVENPLTGASIDTPIAPNGSFTTEIQAVADQVLALSQTVRGVRSEVIFVAGNSRRDAVEVGSEDECFPLPEPTGDACLECVTDAGPEIRGCNLDDFSNEEPLNPANVAQCLFLATDFLELEPLDPEFDRRFGVLNVFNDCNEPVLVAVTEIFATFPERFQVFPEPGAEPQFIEPTFFGFIEVMYDGTGRVPEQPPDEAEIVVSVFVPQEEAEPFLLGTMVVRVFTPPFP